MTVASANEINVFDPEHLEDPYPLYRRLRQQSPVYRVPGTGFFLVSSWELVAEAATRTADFSSHLTATLILRPDGSAGCFDMDHTGQAVHVLATADDPDHALHRKLLSPVLSKRIRAMGPVVDDMVGTLWRLGLREGRIDWVTAMADALPMAVVAAVIGLPGRDVPTLLEWAYDSTEMLGGVTPVDRLGTLMLSAVQLAAYLNDKLDGTKPTAAHREPGDLLAVMADAVATGQLRQEIAVLQLVQLVGAGGESTAGLIAGAARILATDPAVQELLRAQPHRIPAFLDEVLRLESPFRGHHRHVTRDTELGGVDLPADSHLLLLWGAANRDPAVFPDPDVLDLDRNTARRQLSFGKGSHFCIGSALARLEAAATVTALLEHSTRIGLADDAAPIRVPSLFVRRHRSLPLTIR
jgi:cytochrome P450